MTKGAVPIALSLFLTCTLGCGGSTPDADGGGSDSGGGGTDTGARDTGAGDTGASDTGASDAGGSADVGSGNDSGTGTSALISAASGGHVTSADGFFEIWIGPGALSADTTISIDRVPTADVPADLAALSPVGNVYSVEPDGLVFPDDGAFAHYVTPTLPAGVVTPGSPSRYPALIGVSRPRGGGTIDQIPAVVTGYSSGGARVDVIYELPHLSLQTVRYGSTPRGYAVYLEADAGNATQFVGTPWRGNIARLAGREPRRFVTGSGGEYDANITSIVTIGGVVRSPFGPTVIHLLDGPGMPPNFYLGTNLPAYLTMAFGNSSNIATYLAEGREQALAPNGFDGPLRALRPSDAEQMSFVCTGAGQGEVFLGGRIQWEDNPHGVGVSYNERTNQTFVAQRIDCVQPLVIDASCVDLATCHRFGSALDCSGAPTPTCSASARPTTTTTTNLAGSPWFATLSPSADMPAAGPDTITASNSGDTRTATRDSSGTYAWTPTAGTAAFSATATHWSIPPTLAVDVPPPHVSPYHFGPVAGLDTDVVLDSAPLGDLEVRITFPGTTTCHGTSVRDLTVSGVPPIVDHGDGTQGYDAPIRSAVNQLATYCTIAPSTLTASPFYIEVGTSSPATIPFPTTQVRVRTGSTSRIDGAQLIAMCPASRMYCDGFCVNTNTDPMNCGTCGGHPTELCDGFDNDCDGVVDDGCPATLQWFAGDTSISPIYGPPTGVNSGNYSFLCAYPTVMVGICGSDNGPVRTLTYSCGSVTLITDTSTIPYSYRVHVTDSITCTSPGVGWTGGGQVPWAPYHCPADTVMDEILGAADTNIGQIQVRCSGWSVVQSGGGWVVQRSGVTSMSPRFGSGPGTDFAWIMPDHATTGFPGVIRGLNGRIGDLGPYLSISARGGSPFLTLH